MTYHNVKNGFCVLRAKARGHRNVVTVVGYAATIAAGEWITASGEWVNDRTHGQQFKARFLRTSPPTSADGIEKYLSSGMIRASAGLGVPTWTAQESGIPSADNLTPLGAPPPLSALGRKPIRVVPIMSANHLQTKGMLCKRCSQATSLSGSGALILQVSISDAMTAQCTAPPSEPANTAFLRFNAISRMLRSTTSESISMRPRRGSGYARRSPACALR